MSLFSSSAKTSAQSVPWMSYDRLRLLFYISDCWTHLCLCVYSSTRPESWKTFSVSFDLRLPHLYPPTLYVSLTRSVQELHQCSAVKQQHPVVTGVPSCLMFHTVCKMSAFCWPLCFNTENESWLRAASHVLVIEKPYECGVTHLLSVPWIFPDSLGISLRKLQPLKPLGLCCSKSSPYILQLSRRRVYELWFPAHQTDTVIRKSNPLTFRPSILWHPLPHSVLTCAMCGGGNITRRSIRSHTFKTQPLIPETQHTSATKTRNHE